MSATSSHGGPSVHGGRVQGGVWGEALVARGFRAHGVSWSRGDLQAAFERGWLVLRAHVDERDLDPLAADAEWPGLWRLVPRANGLACLFELPPTLVADLARSPDEHELAQATIDWALARAGRAPAAVQETAALREPITPSAPARPEAQWTVRSGAVLAQVRALPGAAHRGLELPLSARALGGLGDARAAWMRALLLDGRERWRLVRCLDGGDVPWARIDLRGAPAEIAEPLEEAALDALRRLGVWLLEPLDLVLDPGSSSIPGLSSIPAWTRALWPRACAPDRSSSRARPASTRRARPVLSPENHHGPLDSSRP